METVRTIEEVRVAVARARAGGKDIAFVPTMGGLHEGHLSLIDAARKACGARGADLVFIPEVETMYPHRMLTHVTVGELSETLCGQRRPTHFAGVCTVVTKLFNIVLPDKAFFGQKDFQQLVIITQMVRDLDIPVEIVSCPIVREDDGLATSTRNYRLKPAHRRQGPALYDALKLAAGRIRGSRPRPPAGEIIAAICHRLAARAPDGEIDYVQIVDPRTLLDVEATEGPVLIALAVKFGDVRLIDNMLVDSADAGQ